MSADDADLWFVGGFAVVLTLLSALGFVIAFTVDPAAGNMAVGAGVPALLFWGFFIALARC